MRREQRVTIRFAIGLAWRAIVRVFGAMRVYGAG